MRAKKSASRRPSLPPTDDPFFIRPVPSPTSASTPSFSAVALDQHVGLAGSRVGTPRPKDGGSGSLGKKLLSFPWTRSDKKHAAQQQLGIVNEAPQPCTSTSSASPSIGALRTTSSLPLGFPPSASATSPADALQRARQHPSFVAISTHVPGHQQSNASLSTINTTSSSASTSLFYSSEDGWQSEATSLTSSPESGRDDKCTPPHLRLWRVRGLAAEGSTTLPDIVERENEDVRASIYDGLSPPGGRETPVRRNSTPIPSAVAAMLADPETPPRLKRYSTSSVTLSPASLEKAAAARCEAAGSEADDEVSPPRARRTLRRAHSQDLLLESPSKGGKRLSPSHRIPSIRFEGISMDAFFAEVEAKVNLELANGVSHAPTQKEAKRRTRVLSTYMAPPSPTIELAPAACTVVEAGRAPVAVPATKLLSTPEATTSAPTVPQLALDVPRPRPYPRRSSSRPAPLDVEAANTLSTWSPRSAPLQASTSIWSPIGSFSTSPGLAAPFDPEPSPALSSTSTYRPSDIPELLVCPPSPPPPGEELVHAPIRPRPRRQSLQGLPSTQPQRVSCAATSPPVSTTRRAPPRPLTIVNGPTKVTVVPEKKVVRVSTRVQASKRKTVAAPPRPMSSPPPPPPPLVEVTPPPPPPRPLPLFDELSSPVSPMTPYVPTDTYCPPNVLRTDFHPALSTLTVPPSPQRSQHGHDSDSSDCEESLHNLLLRLNRPHTPPAPSAASSTESLSLTESALEVHNTSHSRYSMLAREIGVTMAADDDASAKENVPPVRARERSVSACSRRDERRYSKLYDTVDVGFVVPAEPLTMSVPKPLSPTLMHQALVAVSVHAGAEPSSWESEADMPVSPVDDDASVDLESEIDRTLATLVGEQAESSHASSSSSCGSPPRRPGHAQTDSASSLDYLAGAGAGDGVPRSDSHSSQLTASSFESADLEEGVVCLGERVSCMYSAGVIGMAM